MNHDDIEEVALAGVKKHDVCANHLPRYLVRAMMAGFYLALGFTACNICTALLAPTNPGLGKIIGSLAFSLGLIAIIMLGADLFTGNNFVLCVAALEKKVRWSGVLKVWFWSYVGNFIGIVIIISIFAMGGTSNALLADLTASTVTAKLSLSAGQMIFRGILCNFVVCAAVLAGIKIKDATAKILVIAMLIFAFLVAGYDHCIANMNLFTFAFYVLPEVDVLAMLRSMLFVTIGNIIGGALMLGVPYWYMCNIPAPKGAEKK